jgi:hypothetical protein
MKRTKYFISISFLLLYRLRISDIDNLKEDNIISDSLLSFTAVKNWQIPKNMNESAKKYINP